MCLDWFYFVYYNWIIYKVYEFGDIYELNVDIIILGFKWNYFYDDCIEYLRKKRLKIYVREE